MSFDFAKVFSMSSLLEEANLLEGANRVLSATQGGKKVSTAHSSFKHEVVSCLEAIASLKCSHSSPENENLKRNLVWDCKLEYSEISEHWILKIREYGVIDLRDFKILKAYTGF